MMIPRIILLIKFLRKGSKTDGINEISKKQFVWGKQRQGGARTERSNKHNSQHPGFPSPQEHQQKPGVQAKPSLEAPGLFPLHTGQSDYLPLSV